MNEVPDLVLINKIKEEKDESSLKELINRHSPLCHEMYKKFSPAIYSSGLCLNDITDERDYVVYKSALSYDPTKKSKFSTWLANHIRFQCLDAITDNGKYITTQDEDLQNKMEQTEIEPGIDKETISYAMNILEKLEDNRIFKVFFYRYLDEFKKMPWAKIGLKLGVSGQTAINLHRKGLDIIRNELKRA